jgi:hypothetical protein
MEFTERTRKNVNQKNLNQGRLSPQTPEQEAINKELARKRKIEDQKIQNHFNALRGSTLKSRTDQFFAPSGGGN